MYQITELFFYRPVFVLELLIIMHLFLFRFKKRKYYVIRLLFTSLISIGLGFAFPVVTSDPVFISFMFIILFIFSFLGLYFVYDTSWRYIFFVAIAAYTAQHIGHEIYGLLVTSVGLITESTLGMYGTSIIDFTNISDITIFALLIYVAVYLVDYSLVYFLLGKKFNQDHVQIDNFSLLALAAIILLVDIVLNAVIIYIHTGYNKTYQIVTYIYNLLCCLMIFYIQYGLINTKKIKEELDATSKLLHQAETQYQASKENVNLINLKCHDLKHQIREYASKGSLNPKTIKEMENIINIYDSTVKTGNNALDLIISEKSLLCQKKNIKLTCLADCSKLDFMSESELYSLFGNLIDNAIEAVIQLYEIDKRNINIKVK